MLPIFPARGRGVYTPDTPCTGRGVCSLVNRVTLLKLRSELRFDALPATTIDFSGIRTHNLLRANQNRVFEPLGHSAPRYVYIIIIIICL